MNVWQKTVYVVLIFTCFKRRHPCWTSGTGARLTTDLALALTEQNVGLNCERKQEHARVLAMLQCHCISWPQHSVSIHSVSICEGSMHMQQCTWRGPSTHMLNTWAARYDQWQHCAILLHMHSQPILGTPRADTTSFGPGSNREGKKTCLIPN